MNYLSLFGLGLVLINIPACYSQNNECFSQSLKPSYPCCKGDKVVYTDKDGDWGVENNEWCGIGNGPSTASDDSCFSVTLGYQCCESCKVVYTDDDGDWGVEQNKWCGIKDSCTSTDDDIIQNDNPVQKVTDLSETNFEFKFLKIENNKKNMIYSPLSIEYALNMLQDGAVNNTYDEINKVIGNKVLSKYENIDKNLSLANGLFMKDLFYKYIIPEYSNALQEKYNAEVINDPFENAQNVNKWIEDKTLGIIKNVLSDKMVQEIENGMIMINALAIDMKWASQFSYEGTCGNPFYLDDGSEIQVTTMRKTITNNKNFSYYMDDDLTVLTMNFVEYNETQFEFMAIMPNENLTAYVENVSIEQINEIDKNLIFPLNDINEIKICIPKFKFDYQLKLNEDLMKLGIKNAFNEENAEFSKMVDLVKLEANLYVSNTIHKADIEFTEDGVKAAAVTIVTADYYPTTESKLKFPILIKIDKPFMFIIRDKNTKDIWFTGTVYEPNLWENDNLLYKTDKRGPPFANRW